MNIYGKLLIIILFFSPTWNFAQKKVEELPTQENEKQSGEEKVESDASVTNEMVTEKILEYTQQMIDNISYEFDKTPEPSGYDIRKRGFPKGQDIFLLRGNPASELWIKSKGWVKSASLMAEVEGQLVPLKALDEFSLQADNGLFMNGAVQGGNFVATSARTQLNATGTVLRLYLPAIVAYGPNVSKTANIITSFSRIFVRLYSQPYGRGLHKDIEYFLKDKLQLRNKETLKRIKTTRMAKKDVVRFEYRNTTLNINSIKLFEDDRLILSILPKDLIENNSGDLRRDGIKLVKWNLDPENFESVLVFDFYFSKKTDRRFMQVSVATENQDPKSVNYVVGKMQKQKPGSANSVLIVPRS